MVQFCQRYSYFRDQYELVNKKIRPCEENHDMLEFFDCFKKEFVDVLNKFSNQKCFPIYVYEFMIELFPGI